MPAATNNAATDSQGARRRRYCEGSTWYEAVRTAVTTPSLWRRSECVLFARNGVTDDYAFDSTANPVWGIAADESIDIADGLFTDISVKANAYASKDGNTYAVLAEVHRATHETVPIEGETAWAFLSQFSRTAAGEVVVEDGAFDLSALGPTGMRSAQ
jgi:hypothetical protein